MNAVSRALFLYLGLVVFIVLVGWWQGVANISLLMLQASAFALVALGLNIQFGYGGLFNFGIMGMMMIGGFAVAFISYPLNMKFWQSDGPLWLLRAYISFTANNTQNKTTQQTPPKQKPNRPQQTNPHKTRRRHAR